VQVGTPPVDFPVAIDSGSGDLDISGKNCDGCPTTPPNKPYDHTQSKSAKAVFPYVFSNSYQTCDLKNPTAVCTISGKVYNDQVTLAGVGPTTVKVGSIEKQTTNFDQFKIIGGVMGFTSGGDEDVFASLVAAGKCDNVWAICMKEGSKSNGTITIGGVDERLSVGGKVNYVPDVGFGFHSVQVESITLTTSKSHIGKEKKQLMAPLSHDIPVNSAAILDTGTNILLAPTNVMNSLQSSMCSDSSLSQCDALWKNECVELTKEEVDAYPSLAMNLDGTKLEMSSKDYLLLGSPLATKSDQYCLGIRDGGSAGGSGFIIGDTTMRNYYLVFDLAKKQIGWGPVSGNCGNVEAS
jgi:hypothetical protein